MIPKSLTRAQRHWLGIALVVVASVGLWVMSDRRSRANLAEARAARVTMVNNAAIPNYQAALPLYRGVATRYLDRADLLFIVDAAQAMQLPDIEKKYANILTSRFGDDPDEVLRQARLTNTEDAYRAVVERFPAETQGYVALIQFYERTKKLDEAYTVINLPPAGETKLRILILVNLADVANRHGDGGRAKQLYGQILQLEPANQIARQALVQ